MYVSSRYFNTNNQFVNYSLVDNDPHQLFARLEMDLQEFIIEIKLRQMELLNCVHTEEGPHLFIFCKYS